VKVSWYGGRKIRKITINVNGIVRIVGVLIVYDLNKIYTKENVMKFEYDEIEIRERRMEIEYVFRKTSSYSLIEILDHVGFEGWELIGDVQGKIIVKRLITG
jgi:hypothetical protein